MYQDYESYQAPSDYLKINPGINIFRIVSNGFSVEYTHRVGNGYKECKGDDCIYCNEGVDRTVKYVWIALNRETHGIGVLKVPKSVGLQVIDCAKKSKNNPVEFDIEVIRSGEGLKTIYVVNNLGNNSKEITEKEQGLVEKRLSNLSAKYLK